VARSTSCRARRSWTDCVEPSQCWTRSSALLRFHLSGQQMPETGWPGARCQVFLCQPVNFGPENLVLSLKHSARLHGVLLRNVHSSFELGRTRVKKPRGRMQEHPKSHENLHQAVPYNLETTQPTMSDPRNPHCPIPIPPDSRFGREMGRDSESVSRFSRERESGSRGRRAGGLRGLRPLGCARGGAGLFDTSTRPPLAQQSPVAPGDFRVGGDQAAGSCSRPGLPGPMACPWCRLPRTHRRGAAAPLGSSVT
jgi:hypothetical protein